MLDQTNTESPTAHPDYANINTRMKSLNWTGEFDNGVLAYLGYFQSERAGRDKLTCYKCGISTNLIKPGQDPIHWHYSLSPDCAHLHKVIPIDVINKYFEDFDPDVIGLLNENLRSDKPLVNLQYKEYSQRLATFTKWPVTFQDPKKLAEAGFYFTGNRDAVRCFSCNGGLKVWKPEDDPWEEHARHFPHCQHVKQREDIQKSSQVLGQTPNTSCDVDDNTNELDQSQCDDANATGTDVTYEPLDQYVCFECRHSLPDVVLLPCNHHILCMECARPMRRCPACLKIIRQIIRTGQD